MPPSSVSSLIGDLFTKSNYSVGGGGGGGGVDINNMNVIHPQHHADERLFAEKARKFDEADKLFRDLVDSLTAYKAAILNVAECGVTVGTNLEKFFLSHNEKSHKQVAMKYLEAQQSIRSKWLSEAEKSFDADVLAPIKSRLEEIPTVRLYMKNRSNALNEMQKRQKKLQSGRKKDGSKYRDKQRKCKDMSDQYTMFNDDVIKRFNYIERNMGTFVTAPLRSLISIMADVSNSSVQSLDNVVKMVADTPPITKDLLPSPPMMESKEFSGGHAGLEIWDESFIDDQNIDRDVFDDSTTGAATDTNSSPSRQGTGGGYVNGIQRSTTRVRSAEPGTGSSSPNIDPSPFDISSMQNPRRGRSASSAPTPGADSSPSTTGGGNVVPPSLPMYYAPSKSVPVRHHQLSLIPQHATEGFPETAPGSSSGHASQPNGVTSIASSTSMDRISSHAQQQRRRLENRKSSADTVGSVGSCNGRREHLARLVAIYDFTPREGNELALDVGNVIEVVSRNDSGWWCGQCGRSTGYFPQNYTRPLTEKEEEEYMAVKARRRKQRSHRRQESSESRQSGQATLHTHSSVTAM